MIKGAIMMMRYPRLMSLMAGVLASLSLPPFYVMPAFLLFGFVIYQVAMAPNYKQALWHISLGAYGWFVTSLYWISHSLLVGEADYWFLLPVSFLGIPVIVTAFWVVGAMIGYHLAKTPLARAVMVIGWLGLAEWGREFIATGFPWNAPGLLFLAFEPSALLAAYFGQTGLTMLAFAGAGIVPITLIWRRLDEGCKIGLVGALPRIGALMAVIVIAGGSALVIAHEARLPLLAGASDEGLGKDRVIRIVQPAISQDEKWQREKRGNHIAQLMALSRQPASMPLDLIIWPETAFAGDYHAERAMIHGLASQLSADLLTGVIRFDEQGRLYNSAIVIDHQDGLAPVFDDVFYNKTQLVPFGEYVPWRFIPFIDAIAGPLDFTPGDKVAPLMVDRVGLVLPLICYEAIFPALIRGSTIRPDVIVNVTNDGWFGHSTGPYQHLAQTRMTAISYGLPLVRVANTGISALFDGKGREIKRLALGKAGMFDVPLPPPYAPTFFARFGALAALIISLILGGLSYGLDRTSQTRQK